MTEDRWGSGRRHLTERGDDPDPADRVGTSAPGGFAEAAKGEARAPLRAREGSGIAPVIPLFGGGGRERHPARGRSGADEFSHAGSPSSGGSGPHRRGIRRVGENAARFDRVAEANADDAQTENDPAEIRERAENVLVRKLRARSLSLTEARTALRVVEGVDDALAEQIVDHFVDIGYLDDVSLAEQLTMSAAEKRGQGRRAVAETLRKRGVPRDIAEAAIAQMPDDDAERALEFARSKVRSVSGKDYDADLRRLAGQLARRGYPSSTALAAARAALDEAGRGRTRTPFRSAPSTGVRFTPDD